MKRILVLVIFYFTIFLNYSQNLIFEDSVKLVPGIYLNFNEFRFNKPSIPFESNIDSIKIKVNLFDSKSDLKYYTIPIESGIAKRIGYVYGFCDGTSVYFNSDYEEIGPDLKFIRLENIGIYSYFPKLKPIMNSNSVSIVLIDNVIDITDGRTVELRKRDLKDLFKDDIEITNDYKLKNYNSISELISRYSEKKKKDFLKSHDFSKEYEEFKIMTEVYNNLSALIYMDTTELYDNYINRILGYEKYEDFLKIKKEEAFYSDGIRKYIGLKAKHFIGSNGVDYYKIGTWVYFDKNGNIEKVVNYNLLGREKSLNINVKIK